MVLNLINMKEIYFKEEARDKLISGVNKLRDAVASTMGPKGRTVIITDDYGKSTVTKDGVSVARAIYLKDPIENIGAQMVKEVAELTVDKAGDGTTTATVLAAAFINNLKDFDSHDVNKAFDEIIPKVLKHLKDDSKELKRDEIKYVASISANNDMAIGNVIQMAFNHADVVKVEEGTSSEDKLELVNGMTFPVSYFSKHFINTPERAECNFTNPHVVIISGKLTTLKPFEYILKEIAETNGNVVIIAEHINESTLRILETNAASAKLNICVVKSPGYSQHREDLLRDISDLTGATIINDLTKSYTLHYLGKLESIKVSKNNTVLVKHPDIDITPYVNILGEQFVSEDLTQHEQESIKLRMENLSSKISIIKVGAISELEMKERKDRYDDAVLAVGCALEEGIVEGGGIALHKIKENITSDILDYDINSLEYCLYESLSSPMENIINNGAIIHVLDNMFIQNIIDPFKVTRCALENAVSIAKIILSTNTIILHERLWT